MRLRLPWAKDAADAQDEAAIPGTADPASCLHPRVDVEMHGTAIKRRWCTACGADLALPNRGSGG